MDNLYFGSLWQQLLQNYGLLTFMGVYIVGVVSFHGYRQRCQLEVEII